MAASDKPIIWYDQLIIEDFGLIFLAVTKAGLCRVMFGHVDESTLVAELSAALEGDVQVDEARIKPIRATLAGYFAGRITKFDIPLDLALVSTDFQQRVLRETMRIPYGQVISYGDLARRLGKPGASRAVGNALGKNPIPIVIPCHRVIAGGGRIGGFTGGLEYKRRLMRVEGMLLI